MRSQDFKLVRYDADDGMVFDWIEPHYREEMDEETGEYIIKKEQEHLYVKTLFIGGNDSIDNYYEVLEVKE
jgi:hypothetical protein